MNTNMRQSIPACLSRGTTQSIPRPSPYFVTLKHTALHPKQQRTESYLNPLPCQSPNSLIQCNA